jgi:CO dehydrogenase maturation factor
MKLAVVGKGGVGKTTLAGLLARVWAERGYRVLAVDADPDANLASMLPLDDGAVRPQPLAARRDLIDTLSGRSVLPGGMVLLNPDVGQVLPELRVSWGGGHGLVSLGWHKGGGQGCYCAEHATLKRVLSAVVTGPVDVVVIDAEAGLEHLSRGTAAAADAVVVVVQPGRRSVETAFAARALATDLGLNRVHPVLVGYADAGQVEQVQQALGDWPLLAALPWHDEIRRADLEGRPPAIPDPLQAPLQRLALTLIASTPTSRP